MKLAIVGSLEKHFSRDDRKAALWVIYGVIRKYKPAMIVSGGAEGVDTWAEQIAKALGIDTDIYCPSNPVWEPHGFKERNEKIVDACDVLVRIRHVKSETYGSGWTADRARALGKEVEEFPVGGIFTEMLLGKDQGATRVVHCKRESYDVYVGRPSEWGNPFVLGKDGTREEVIEKYRKWLLEQPGLVSRLPELRGKVLSCWCAPQACHGDVLAELADSDLGRRYTW